MRFADWLAAFHARFVRPRALQSDSATCSTACHHAGVISLTPALRQQPDPHDALRQRQQRRLTLRLLGTHGRQGVFRCTPAAFRRSLHLYVFCASQMKRTLVGRKPRAKRSRKPAAAEAAPEASALDTARAAPSDSSDAGDSEPELLEPSDGSKGEEVVDVELNFMDPQEIDFLSVKQLLRPYMPGCDGLVTSEITDAIIKQVEVGTMIKVGDDVDVYGFATALSLKAHEVCAHCC